MELVENLPPELLAPGDTNPEPEKDVKTRLPEGRSAREIHKQLRLEDRKRSFRRALHKGMVDAARPFPEDGSGQCNLNFQDGKAIMSQSSVPYYAIINGVRNYAEVKTTAQPDNPDRKLWDDKVSRRFHDLLSRWNGFDWNIQQASYWMRLHGVGPCYFDRPNDWRFRSIETGQMLAPAGSASCVDERLPILEIVVPYRAHELFEFIRDSEVAQKLGWKVPAVKRAIRYYVREQSWAKTNDGGIVMWEVIERMFNNNDLMPSLTGKFINCVHQLFKEWDGTISKTIITEDVVPPDEGGRGDENGFLFQDIGCYEAYGDCVVVFFKEIGDGTWHSVKGYASDAFDTLVITNQLYCAMIDAARVDSTILLEFQTTAQRDKFDKFQIKRGITKLPVGAKVQQARMQGSMQGAQVVSQMLSTKLNNNIGNFQGRGMSREDGKGETVTATEVEARVAKEASLNQGEMTLFYGYLDHLYQTMFDRATDPSSTDEEARRFQRECEEDGVPAEAFLDCEVRANRESGYGSPAMRELKLQQLRELAPSLPTEGQSNLLDMEISAIAGPDKVVLLNPRQHPPDLNDWSAAMENSAIEQGINPPLVSGQDDIIHLHSHLDAAAQKLTPIKQAMDAGQNDAAALQDAFQYTQIMAAHCQAHLQRVMADPTRKAEGRFFADNLQHIVSFSGKLRAAVVNVQKEAQLAAEQQQQATALGALDQAKLQSVQTHDQIAAMKAATSIRDKSAKVANDIRIQSIQAAADIHIKRVQAVQTPPKSKAA